LARLGFAPKDIVAIVHADDVGMCRGANAAFAELSLTGVVNCGAVMVPCPWFNDAAAMAAGGPDLDLGVHLTLTSEWKTYRWGPISTTRKSSGLIDDEGFFWHRVPMLAAAVVPDAAEAEMRAQIDRALSAGIDITHIDSHMGAAMLPQLVDIYVRLGREYRLPVLLPRQFAGLAAVLEVGNAPPAMYADLVSGIEADGWPLVDHFAMTPGVASGDSDRAYRDLIAGLQPGLTFLALHPNVPGDIEHIVPARAHFRTDEYRLLKNPEFRDFIAGKGVRTIGFRPMRDLMRGAGQ
jgi:predicted glycoside hydrolase/deacetylase ChbG (UPF0249 family)